MKEFIEKLIGRLEEVYKDDICDLIPNCDEFKNCKDCRKEFIKKAIEPVLEEYNGGWIPCSGCKDCRHKECEHYGKI